MCQALMRRGRSQHWPGLRASLCVRGLLPNSSSSEGPCNEGRSGFQLRKAPDIHISHPTFLRGLLRFCPLPLGCSYSEIQGPQEWHV